MDSHFVLYELSRMLESVDGTTQTTSSRFGNLLGVSQQTASRYLAELEEKGLIKRVIKKRGQQITLTKEGISVLEEMYYELGYFIKGIKTVEIEGKINIGLGEGAYYVRMYADKIEKELGFRPYYGTLNISVDEIPSSVQRFAFKTIPAFEKQGRSFGEIKIVKIRLLSGQKYVDCFLILPERTHHKNELELISKTNLRKKLNLKDGSRVKIKVYR